MVVNVSLIRCKYCNHTGEATRQFRAHYIENGVLKCGACNRILRRGVKDPQQKLDV